MGITAKTHCWRRPALALAPEHAALPLPLPLPTATPRITDTQAQPFRSLS